MNARTGFSARLPDVLQGTNLRALAGPILARMEAPRRRWPERAAHRWRLSEVRLRGSAVAAGARRNTIGL